MRFQAPINLFKQKLRKKISELIAPLTLRVYKKRYRAFAPPEKTIYIDPGEIQSWFGGNRYDRVTFPGQIRGGDWSNHVRGKDELGNIRIKHDAVKERYRNGKSWIKTRLFCSVYKPELAKGKKIHGTNDLEKLEQYYEVRYDSIYESLKKRGFLPSPGRGSEIAPVYVNIDENGELLYTVDGNHRLAMCKVLGIRRMPVRVWMRHAEWQQKREIIIGAKDSAERDSLIKRFGDHPDIISERSAAEKNQQKFTIKDAVYS